MKLLLYVSVVIASIIYTGCKSRSADDLNSGKAAADEKHQVIKKDPNYALETKTEEYRTTAYNSRLLPDPDGNTEIARIPVNTKLKVIEMQTVQQGRMQNNWYKVKYKNKTGWVSGWNMKEGEQLVVTSVEEMERNYERKIGSKPKNDPLTGKINAVTEWLGKNAYDKKSIEYVQWYEPYFLNNCWNCRVEYKAKNRLGNVISEDKIFKVKNGSVISVADKNE